MMLTEARDTFDRIPGMLVTGWTSRPCSIDGEAHISKKPLIYLNSDAAEVNDRQHHLLCAVEILIFQDIGSAVCDA